MLMTPIEDHFESGDNVPNRICQSRDNPFTELLITKNVAVGAPSLSEEVRAQTDTLFYASNASLLLNNTSTTRCDIIGSLLDKIFSENMFKNEEKVTLINKATDALIMYNNDNIGDFQQFSKTVQGFVHQDDGTMSIDPSWVICMASMSEIDKRLVGITTTMHPINLGSCNVSVHILAIVLTPFNEKAIKGDVETSKNIATILADLKFRQAIHRKDLTEKDFQEIFLETAQTFIKQDSNKIVLTKKAEDKYNANKSVCFGRGIRDDLRQRIKYYLSDYSDAFSDRNSILKTLTAISFLFFSNLLSTIAFGMLNETNTNSKINVASGLISQAIGGAGFALLSGQHLTPLLTTAPLSIVTLILYKISINFGYDFFSFYALVGVFVALYLCICAITGLSRLMRFSRRSIEDTFSFFIAIAYVIIVIEDFIKVVEDSDQSLEGGLLFILLLFGTVTVSLWLHHFTNTPFLNPICRTILAGGALPVSVLLMSTIRGTIFGNVKMYNFKVPQWRNITLNMADFRAVPIEAVGSAAVLAMPITILLFMAHNISSSIVNSSSNKLTKGTSYHWDILILGTLNMALSMVGLPWLCGAPLHAGLHVKSLATIEEHVDQSNHITQRVVKVVETRISCVLANILIGASIFLMPYPLLYIPSPVLNGIFLYIALSSIKNNQLFERLLLLVTEQNAYPPNHYLKRVPQKAVHFFTLIQTIELIVLCSIGFAPLIYVKIMFPIVLIWQLASNHVILPRLISARYLDALDKSI